MVVSALWTVYLYQIEKNPQLQENYNTPLEHTRSAIPLANYERNPMKVDKGFFGVCSSSVC